MTKIRGLLVAACLALPHTTSAQIKASEHAEVSQTIDGTTISLVYARPGLRGRDLFTDLFGDQIPWGRTWTPGANHATTLTSDHDFVLDGVDVAAGTWSVWMVPGEDEWEFVLDPDSDRYHTQHPDRTDDQIRFPIDAARTDHVVQNLTWSFPAIRTDGAELRMQWGDLVVDLNIEVEPSMKVTLTPEEAAPYVGTWAIVQPQTSYSERYEFDLELEYVDGHLLAEMEFGPDFRMDVMFVMAADQIFRMAQLDDGEISEVDMYSYFEFTLDESGRAVSFDNRDTDDEVGMQGTRSRD